MSVARSRPWWLAAALGAALVAGAVSLWVLRGGATDADVTAQRGEGAEASVGVEGGVAGAPLVPAPGERSPLASEPAVGAEPAAVAETAAAGLSAVASWTGPMSTFTGVVVDHEGQPLAGATVTCWPGDITRNALGIPRNCVRPEIDPGLQARTDDGGRFTLRAPNVPPSLGKLYIDELRDFPLLLIDADGFAVRSVPCAGLMTGDYDAGTIAVEPGGEMIGRVVDERGQPVGGARLAARQNRCDPRHVATKDDWKAYSQINHIVSDLSGEDGRFRLGGFWAGTASSWIYADGFLTASRELVEIEVGAQRDLGDVVLSSGASLSGTVVDEAGTPVARAGVLVDEVEMDELNPKLHDTALSDIERQRSQGETFHETDAEGHFTLSGLQPANHRLFVDAPGFEPLCVRDVTPRPEPLRVALVKQAILQLGVVDAETQEPVAGAQVKAVRRAGEVETWPEPELTVRGRTETGTFIVERIGTWRTDLVIAAPGFATAASSIEGVTPPETVSATVALQREARVTGRVLTADGLPIAGATVTTLEPKDEKDEHDDEGTSAASLLPARSATSGADGRYELLSLSGGEWTLSASAPGFIATEQAVEVPPAGTRPDVDFLLEAAATIHGTCFAGDGQPIPGKMITLRRSSDQPRRDDWVVVATNVQGDYRAEGLRAGQWKVGDDPAPVAEVAPGQIVRVDLREQLKAVIRGQVLADGLPKTGAIAMALDREAEKRTGFAHPAGIARVDAEGRYELEIDAGEYYMQAGGTDPPCGGSAVVPLTVSWGEQRVVDLVFGGERVSLLIVEAGSGRPIEGASPMLKRASADDPLTPTFSFGNTGDRTEFWPHTGADGRAELPYMLPGRYTLSCRLDGYLNPADREVVVTAGEAQELRIELQAEASLNGMARLSSGVPVADYTYLTLRLDSGKDQHAERAETENGAFHFGRLAAGDYTLALWRGYPGSPHASPEPPLVELPVTLKAGESKVVELVVPP